MKNRISYGRVIINADDFGISEEVNDAIFYCLNKGLIDRTSLMVNMPYAEKAVQLVKDSGLEGKVGLHINLTEGIPISEEIKHTPFCDADGSFNESISSSKYKFGFFSFKMVHCVEAEIEAQMERFINFDLPLRHVDSHEHVHIEPSVFPSFLKCAKKYGFFSMRLAGDLVTSNSLIRVYKRFINTRIKKYNANDQAMTSGYPQITKACGYATLKAYLEENGSRLFHSNNVETWFHPAMIDGKIENIWSDIPFDIGELKVFDAYRGY